MKSITSISVLATYKSSPERFYLQGKKYSQFVDCFQFHFPFRFRIYLSLYVLFKYKKQCSQVHMKIVNNEQMFFVFFRTCVSVLVKNCFLVLLFYSLFNYLHSLLGFFISFPFSSTSNGFCFCLCVRI